jgi:hypothetical protein
MTINCSCYLEPRCRSAAKYGERTPQGALPTFLRDDQYWCGVPRKLRLSTGAQGVMKILDGTDINLLFRSEEEIQMWEKAVDEFLEKANLDDVKKSKYSSFFKGLGRNELLDRTSGEATEEVAMRIAVVDYI